tara:strand:- start:83 stop:409 length:327 start_codon:yes stop_codon:yes gene_type:complete
MPYPYDGLNIWLLYEGSETFASDAEFRASSFFQNIQTMHSSVGSGDLKTGITPGGKYWACIEFEDNSGKVGFINWCNDNHLTLVNQIKTDRGNLPEGQTAWPDYLATI